MKLTNKYAESVALYYAADGIAEQNLQCIENILSTASKTSANKAAFIAEQCSKYNFLYTQKNNKIYIIFNENINTTQTLHVVVQVSSISSGTYEILQWKKLNLNEVNIDESINVYK